jgi:competence protein ComEA
MHMSPRERIGYASLVGLLLFAFGIIGARHLRQPAPIVFENTSARGNLPAAKSNASYQARVADPASDTVGDVYVHVAGAVKTPGVVHLRANARVVDAIHAAGGPSTNADLDSIDLAAKLVDGTQLKVPTRSAPAHRVEANHASSTGGLPPLPIDKSGYFAPASVAPEYRADASSVKTASPETTLQTSGHRSGKKTVGDVNINSATLEELQSLPGVGAATAQKILDYRQAHGSFKTADELTAVKGIGPKKLDKMRPYVKL